MDTGDCKPRRKHIYSMKKCAFCGEMFRPATSKPTTCGWQCRFRLIQQDFRESDECWRWPQSLSVQTGYGQFHAEIDGKRNHTAHRISYLVNKGCIPPGLVVMHSCDNRWCFNPRHLAAGTQADNLHDMRQKGRANDSERLRLEQHPNSKLTISAVLEIRASSLSDAKLAEKYGVSATAVNLARRGISWKIPGGDLP